jgi:hypothetical protein
METKSPKKATERTPSDQRKPSDNGRMTKSGRLRIRDIKRRKPAAPEIEHEGGTDKEIGDRTGPGAGYDQEPTKEKTRGGVA